MSNQVITEEHEEKEVKIKVKNAKRQDILDLQNILAQKWGRRVIWKYLEFCKIFTTSMTGNNWTYYNEGQRNVGNKILADVMEANPDAFIQMSKESKEGKSNV